MSQNTLILLSLFLVINASSIGDGGPNPTLFDYQKQLKALEQNSSVAAIEEASYIYGCMATIAYNLGDTNAADEYRGKQTHLNLLLHEARGDAQRVSAYQESLGVNVSDLFANANVSEARAYSDPLNASAWRELERVYADLMIYYQYTGIAMNVIWPEKDDASTAADMAEDIQLYGEEDYRYKSGRSYYGGNYTALVSQTAEKMVAVKKYEAELAQYRDKYEMALNNIRSDERADWVNSSGACATLSHDYIVLANAIAGWNEFNASNSTLTIYNNLTPEECRRYAIDYIDRAIVLAVHEPISGYWLRKGRIYNILGEGVNAAECFDRGITSAISEQNNETLIGCLYLKAKGETDLNQAAKCYEDILTIDTYDSRIWKELSRIYKILGRYNDASDASDNANLFQYEDKGVLPNLPSIYL